MSVLLPKRVISGLRREFTISQLFDSSAHSSSAELSQILTPGERSLLTTILPPWKSTPTWPTAKQIAFVESIFLGFGCGYYVCNGVDWDENNQRKLGSGWLIDGEQRLHSLQSFIQNGLALFDGTVSYAEMDLRQKRQFGNESFPCYLLDYTDNISALMSLSFRLNNHGELPPSIVEDIPEPCLDVAVDPLYATAWVYLQQQKTLTLESLQTRLKIGYNRTWRILERMESEKLVDRVGEGAATRFNQRSSSPI